MNKIYIDGELPKSCASCDFLVHCDACEGHENYCPFIGHVGYDISDDLIDGTRVTFVTKRHDHCPLKQRPHGEWIKDGFFAVCSNCDHELQHYDLVVSQIHFCPNCGAKMEVMRNDRA